ncbi:MAG TPA: PEP-CTERM sorting domain-containing protein [Bryobacteraceae bacterium]|nr:PEP-CTERM sorting domain-containing protein [Bryobacteraceae bacterium]
MRDRTIFASAFAVAILCVSAIAAPARSPAPAATQESGTTAVDAPTPETRVDPVPEPESIWLAGTGIVAVILIRKFRNR